MKDGVVRPPPLPSRRLSSSSPLLPENRLPPFNPATCKRVSFSSDDNDEKHTPPPPPPLLPPRPLPTAPPDPPVLNRGGQLRFLIHDVVVDLYLTPADTLPELRFIHNRAAFLRDELVSDLPGRTLVTIKGIMEEGRKGVWKGWIEQINTSAIGPDLFYFHFQDTIGLLFQQRMFLPRVHLALEKKEPKSCLCM